MAQAGPYRDRLDEPASVDGYWRQLRRERLWRRVLPAIIFFLALSPAVAVAISGRTPTAPAWYGAQLRGARAPADSWGLVISAERVRPWWGPLSLSAQRPSRADSPISAEQIQEAVSAQSSVLRDCYVRSETYASQSGGELAASILIRRDGEVEVAVGGNDELERSGVSGCVERMLDRLSFPAPRTDYGWVHMPLLFEP
jgi:hypothetical protein